MAQELIDFLTRYWVWIALGVAIAFYLLSIKNKLFRKKMNSLFGWPPEP